MVEKLVYLSSSLWGEIAELWGATIIIVLIASAIHYAWATRARKETAGKYRRRAPDVRQEVFDNWRLGRDDSPSAGLRPD